MISLLKQSMKLFFQNESPTNDTGDNLFNQSEIDIQERRFITSPTDIEVHCKVDLRDAVINESNKQ